MDPSKMPPIHRKTLEGNGNLQERCEIVASLPLTPETSLGGARYVFFCFTHIPLTWREGRDGGGE